MNTFINYLKLFLEYILNNQNISPQTCNFDHLYHALCHDNSLNKSMFYFNKFDKEKLYFIYLFFSYYFHKDLFLILLRKCHFFLNRSKIKKIMTRKKA